MAKPFTITPFDVNERASFAQALDLALTQDKIDCSTPGSLVTETRRGDRKFVYWHRYGPDGKPTKEYVGPLNGENEKAAAEMCQDLNLIRDTSKKLRRIGFASVDSSTALVLATLHNAQFFRERGILVGTHAYGALLNYLGVKATPYPLTEDVDLAADLKLAIKPQTTLLNILKDTGLPFFEVSGLKRSVPSTSFKVRGSRLIVDLLTHTKGEPYKPILISGLSTHATGLPFLDYLMQDPLRAIIVGKDRLIPVLIPKPARFCVHKIVISQLRPSGGSKSSKDIFQAAVLLVALSMTQEFEWEDALSGLNPTLKKKLISGVPKVLELLGDHYPAASHWFM